MRKIERQGGARSAVPGVAGCCWHSHEKRCGGQAAVTQSLHLTHAEGASAARCERGSARHGANPRPASLHADPRARRAAPRARERAPGFAPSSGFSRAHPGFSRAHPRARTRGRAFRVARRLHAGADSASNSCAVKSGSRARDSRRHLAVRGHGIALVDEGEADRVAGTDSFQPSCLVTTPSPLRSARANTSGAPANSARVTRPSSLRSKRARKPSASIARLARAISSLVT